MLNDPFTAEQKSKLKCLSDAALFYKEMMRDITGSRKGPLFDIDLDNLSWVDCRKEVKVVWTYFQDSDGNMHRIKGP
jgi:hypothetical protein